MLKRAFSIMLAAISLLTASFSARAVNIVVDGTLSEDEWRTAENKIVISSEEQSGCGISYANVKTVIDEAAGRCYLGIMVMHEPGTGDEDCFAVSFSTEGSEEYFLTEDGLTVSDRFLDISAAITKMDDEDHVCEACLNLEPGHENSVTLRFYDADGVRSEIRYEFDPDPEPVTEAGYTVITFDPRGGTVAERSRRVVTGSRYGELPIPVREGYNFTGWFSQPDGGLGITDKTVANEEGSFTVYAHWAQSIRKVKLDDLMVAFKSTAFLAPQISPSGAKRTKTEFISSNPKTVSVDPDGTVHGLKRGKATVTCVVTDETGNTLKASCTVTVKYTSVQWLIMIFLLGFIWYK